jgi:SAM-dependent methyltransferase
VRILKRGLDHLDGEYDFVMLHHSFEHIPDSAAALAALGRRLAPGGTLLIRIPVADSFARQHYGINWLNWDAPRHLYLHTRRSMELLAASAGMEIFSVAYDSHAQQFVSSELYARGVPYVEHGKYRPGESPDAFSRDQWDGYAAQAAELNRRGEGDTACFLLRQQGTSGRPTASPGRQASGR